MFVVCGEACFRIGTFGLLVALIYNDIVMEEGRTSSSDRHELVSVNVGCGS